MKTLSSLFAFSLCMAFLQNLVIFNGVSLSESIRFSKRPKYLITSNILIFFFSLCAGLSSSLLTYIPGFKNLSMVIKLSIVIIIIAILNILVCVFTKYVLKGGKKLLDSINISGLNALIALIPLFVTKQELNPLFALIFSVFVSISFFVSNILLIGAMKFLKSNDSIPPAFRGTPSLLIFTAILSLAFSSVGFLTI